MSPTTISPNTISRISKTFKSLFEWVRFRIRPIDLENPAADSLDRIHISGTVEEIIGNPTTNRAVNQVGLSLRVARNIDWYLDAYPGLDVDEKQTVDDLVSECPEYRYRFQEAVAMNELLQDAGALLDGERDSETAGFSFMSEYIPASFTPKSIGMALTRFIRRLPGNADVAAAYETYRDRVGEDPGFRPAIDHFEEVTGHVIRESGIEYKFKRANRLNFWNRPHSGFNHIRHRNGDRAAVPGRHGRGVKAAVSLASPLAIVAAVFVVLYSVNYANQSPTERMAHIHSSDLNWVDVGLSNRGLLADWELEAYEQYDRAVHIVAKSRKSVFGLFRTYRSEDLYLARRILNDTQKDLRVARRQLPEALLLLGKLNFLLGDVDKAIPVIRDASFQDGPAADKADKFLRLFGPQNK